MAELKSAVSSTAALSKSSREYGVNDHPPLSTFKASKTVFGRTWSLVFIDEAHSIRSKDNTLLKAAIVFRDIAGFLILLTATPLYNAESVGVSYVFSLNNWLILTKDLVSMGIALGSENIDDLVQKEKEVKRHIAKYRKFRPEDTEMETRLEGAKAFLQGGDTEIFVQAEEEFWQSEKMAFRIQSVQDMRRWLGDVVIRRTANSKRRDNRLISGLEPPVIRQFKIDMGEEERKSFIEIAKRYDTEM